MQSFKKIVLIFSIIFVFNTINAQDYIWYQTDYEFEDISVDDNNIVTQLDGDDNETSVEINLSNYFNFYGTDYPRIKIAVDGAITLDMNVSFISSMNGQIPSSSAPNLLIAPYWNDISNVDSESEIYYHTNTERAIIQWENMEILNSGGRISMQVVLKYSDNSITFSYKDVSPDVPGNEHYATIGMQNLSGTEGILLSFNDFFAEGFELANEKTYKILIPEAYPPQMNPQSGTYTETLSVEITSETPEAVIYYTTDGSEPTISSILYENPVEISETITLKAIATKNDYVTQTVTENYFIITDGTPIEAGTLSGTLTTDNSPYYVIGDVEIPNGNCLTIEAGTEIFIAGDFEIDVKGCINAIGTENEPIIFDKGFSSDSWNGFSFLDIQTGNSASFFEYCEFYNAKADSETNNNGGVFRIENWDLLTISNCIFEFNYAENYGGAIYCNNADIELINNLFNDNSSDNLGGAIYAENSEINITENVFEYNSAENAGGAIVGSQLQNALISENYIAYNEVLSSISAGGGIALYSSNAEITYNEIAENEAYSEGGGAFLVNSDDIFFAYNNVHHNRTNHEAFFKYNKSVLPKVQNFKNQPLLLNNKVYNNFSQTEYTKFQQKNNSPKGNGSGGGLQISGGTGLVASNRIENNFSDFRGGGICLTNSDIQVNSNLFVYNIANDGGGAIAISGCNSPLANNSFLFNQSNLNGNAIVITNSSPDIYNSLFWYNIGDDTYGDIFINNDGSVPNFYNCSNTYGIDGLDGDFYGGWTFTGDFENCTYNYPIYEIENSEILGIKEYSAMVNNGLDLPANIQLPEFDVNGNPRTFDGSIDVGCFEYNEILTLNILNGETTGDLTEGIYYAQSNLIVPEGETLTIAAGTEIFFTGNYGIRVYGNIQANGTEDNPIKISVADTLGFNEYILYTTGAWRNIAFFDCNESSFFKYVDFQFSKVNNLFLENIEDNAGGVAIVINSSPEFENCNFIHNFTYGAGGALAYLDTEKKGGRVVNCNFFGNYSVSSHYMFENQGGHGGAIYLQNSSPKILGSIFQQNLALQGAGAGYGIGGAIFALNTQSEFVNNTFVDNYSPNAGAFYTTESEEIELVNSPVFVNNIFWENQADNPLYGNQIRLDGNTENIQFLNNDIEGGLSQIIIGTDDQFYGIYTDNIDDNPQFTPDFKIPDDSPCKDSGLEDMSGFNLPEFDINGNTRYVNDTIDIGATENQFFIINSILENSSLSIDVFPNPTTDVLFIHSYNAEIENIEIVDLNGKILVKSIPKSNKIKIDLTDFEHGLYLLNIETKKQKSTRKIIKK